MIARKKFDNEKGKLVRQYLRRTFSNLAEFTDKTETILKILHKKMKFSIKKFNNMNKSTISCEFVHVYKRNPSWKHFFVHLNLRSVKSKHSIKNHNCTWFSAVEILWKRTISVEFSFVRLAHAFPQNFNSRKSV